MYKRKSFFSLNINALNKRLTKGNNLNPIPFFKTNLLINLFFRYFGWKNFNLFFRYFFLKKTLTQIVKNQNLSCKTYSFSLYKYFFLFFFQKWKVLECFLVPKILWFNIKFLLKKKNLLLLFFSYLSNLNKNSKNKLNLINLKLQINPIFFDMFLYKLKVILNNTTAYFENIKFMYFYKSYMRLIFCQNFLRIKHTFAKTYIGYQSFINTNLYLNWSLIFNHTLGGSSFNFLLLKNFNKILFWVGDVDQTNFLAEFLIWGDRNVIIRKGEPYYTYRLGPNKNNFIPFYTFDWLLKSTDINNHKFKNINFCNFIFLNN